MKILYATSIRYPARYANRIQILATAEALRTRLGNDFILAGNHIHAPGLYGGRVLECHTRFGPFLAWQQLSLIKRESIPFVFSRESMLLFLMMFLNMVWFRQQLQFIYEAHDVEKTVHLRFVLARIRHAFCLTSYVANELRALCPRLSTSVLPDGVDVEKFVPSETKEESRKRLGLLADQSVVLYIGRLDGWKGLETLYAASTLLSKDVQVVVIGGAAQEISALKTAHPHIRFVGPRPYEELPNNMVAADVLVLPNTAKKAISARYTSPLKLFAYMTSGVPIVASDLPSIREVVDEELVFLIPADEPEALARGIATALASRDEGFRRAEKARQDVRAYDWSYRGDHILAVLQGL